MTATTTLKSAAAVRAYGKAYGSAAKLELANDVDLAALLKGQTYDERIAARGEFIEGAKESGYTAPDKLWERTIARLVEFHDLDRPKATTKKAQDVSAKREAAKEAEKKALEIIAKAKGLTVEKATPQQLLQLATDPKLTTANKKILVDAAMRKEKEEAKEKQKAANDADKAVREEIRDLLAKMHGPQLAKALAALKKIK